MFFADDQEIRMIDELSRDFSEKELEEKKEERDRFPFVPWDDSAVKKAWELGLFSLNLPEEKGGASDPLASLCVVLRNMANVDAGFAAILFAHSFAQEILNLTGYQDVSSTETGHGESIDLLAFPVFDRPEDAAKGLGAVRKNEEWLLSGRVDYLVLGGLAERALLPAVSGESEGVSLFLSFSSQEGWKRKIPVAGLGVRACPASEVELSGVRAELLGEEGKGVEYFRDAEDRFSPAAASICLGLMESSFREAAGYAKERVQGGREIINWSEVRMILSSMAMACRNVEMLIEQAVREIREGRVGWRLSSRTSLLVAQDLVRQVTSDGIQLLGGIGYIKDYGQEKRFRDGHHLLSLMGHYPSRKLETLRLLEDRAV